MAEITQRLGFEAGQAIATLATLRTALSRVNTQITRFNTVTAAGRADTIVRGFAATSAAAQSTSRNIAATNAAFDRAGESGQKAAQSITLSWETMLRVVQTQVLVRALSATIDLFGQTADAAAEFQIEVARISNIARGPAGEIEALSGSLNDLSVALGRPIEEINEAAFEALQNDVGTTEETFRLLEGAANDLALATGSELVNSVNTISSVIKSFGLDIEESDRVADVFFGTIDAGRVSLEDLANSLGNVAPLSNQLGVGLEELGASIAAITLQGVDAARAQTQLRGIFNALLKPTTALKDAFEELGVASGEELIETTGGLIQALQALEGVAGENEQQFAAFFGRIRGQLGALNILNDGASEATRVLGELRDNAGAAADAAATIDETGGREAQRQFEELNRTMRELGEATLEIRTTFITLFNDIIADGRAAAVAIGALTTAVLAGGAAALALGVGFGAALLPITAAAAAAVGLGLALNAGIEAAEEFFGTVDQGAALTEERLGNVQEAVAEIIETQTADIEASANAQKEAIADFTNDASSRYRSLADVARQTGEDIAAASSSAVENFGSSIDNIIGQIDDTIAGISDRIRGLQEDAAGTRQSLEDFNFERSIRGADDLTAATQRTQRAQQALNELQQAAQQVTADPATQESFNDQLRRTNQLLNEQLRTADRASDPAAVDAAENLRRRGFEQTAQLQEDIARRLSQTQDDLNAGNVEAQKRRLRELADLAEQIAEAQAQQQEADLGEGPISPDAARQQVQALEQEFADAFTGLDFNLLDQLGVDQFATEAAFEVATALDNADVQWTNAVDALQEALRGREFEAAVRFQQEAGAATGNVGLDADLQDAGQTLDPGARIDETIDALSQFQTAQAEVAATAQQFGAEAAVQAARVSDAVNEAFSQTGFLDGLALSADVAFTRITQGAEQAGQVIRGTTVGSIGQELQNISTQIEATNASQAQAINAQLDLAQQVVQRATEQGSLNAEQGEALVAGIDAARAQLEATLAQQAQQELIDPAAAAQAEARLDRLGDVAAATELGLDPSVLLEGVSQIEESATQTQASLQNTSTQAQTVATTIGTAIPAASNTASTSVGTISSTMTGVVSSTNQATSAMNRLAAAAQRAAAAAAQARAASAGALFHGGKIPFRQGGGTLRGQDSLLAAVAPGEFIVNQRASRNFAAQLTALNAGQRPQFREQGGPVTNIGDVNVTVNTDSSGGINARELGLDIRRELRRDTLRLS
jgi:TP901 family phage tail tape measure protein